MNKWLIIGIAVVVVLIIVGVAYDQGAFDNITFGGAATVFAALAAPYLAIKKMLFGNREVKQFQDKYQQVKSQEIAHRSGMDQQIKAKEQRIAALDKEIQLLDAKMEVLELKKKRVEQDVNNMSIEDKKKEVRNLFGD